MFDNRLDNEMESISHFTAVIECDEPKESLTAILIHTFDKGCTWWVWWPHAKQFGIVKFGQPFLPNAEAYYASPLDANPNIRGDDWVRPQL